MKTVATDKAPAAIGPYSQAMRVGETIYCSGQIPIVAKSGAVIAGGIVPQTEQVLSNLAAVLEAAGSSLQGIARTTVYLADMGDFAAMNSEYDRIMAGHKPARATVEVARLPRDVLVEIDCIAVGEAN